MTHKPNDDRANVKNPNNPAYDKDRTNREKQAPRPSPPKPKK